MAGKRRIQYTGAIYHALNRGTGHAPASRFSGRQNRPAIASGYHHDFDVDFSTTQHGRCRLAGKPASSGERKTIICDYAGLTRLQAGANLPSDKHYSEYRELLKHAKNQAAAVVNGTAHSPWPGAIILNWKTKGSKPPGPRSVYVGTAGGNDFYSVVPRGKK